MLDKQNILIITPSSTEQHWPRDIFSSLVSCFVLAQSGFKPRFFECQTPLALLLSPCHSLISKRCVVEQRCNHLRSNIRQRNWEQWGKVACLVHVFPTLTLFYLKPYDWRISTPALQKPSSCFAHATPHFPSLPLKDQEMNQEMILRLIKLILHLLSSVRVWWFSGPLNKGSLLMAIFYLVQKMFCATSISKPVILSHFVLNSDWVFWRSNLVNVVCLWLGELVFFG